MAYRDDENGARSKKFMGMNLTPKKFFSLGILLIIFVVGLICIPQIFETVEKGTYAIKQAAITGAMSAKMSPGIMWQGFGDIDTWPKAETFFFTSEQDVKGDTNVDSSMEVQFNDGSICNISGTARILMPVTQEDAINLVTVRGHKTYLDAENKLIKPTIRNVLRNTANLMTATESYMTKRSQFISWSRDQIQNGLYATTTDTKRVKDLVSGEETWSEVTVIKTEDGTPNGKPVYQFNPLKGTGITVDNFEIKQFRYEEKVKNQIAKQQEARMAVATSKAKAQEAEQDKITIEVEGKARVAKAEYAEKEKKIVVIVQAERDKEEAIIKANKQKEMEAIAKQEAIIKGEKEREVALLDAEAAAAEKKANILRGEGEASRKKMVMEADGALQLKAETWLAAQEIYAREFGKQKWVPEIQMGSSTDSSGGDTVSQFMEILGAKAAKDLAFELTMEKQTKQ